MSVRNIYICMAIALTVFWSLFIWMGMRLVPPERKVDCSLAEISPDYTQKMKDQCRKVRT